MRYHHSYCCLTYMIGWNKCRGYCNLSRHKVSCSAFSHVVILAIMQKTEPVSGFRSFVACLACGPNRGLPGAPGGVRAGLGGVFVRVHACGGVKPSVGRVACCGAPFRGSAARPISVSGTHPRSRVPPACGTAGSRSTFTQYANDIETSGYSKSWTVPGAEFDWGGTSPKQ